ncbi:leucyl aminopeptidase [Xanthomonadaceae bacterium JHOS43]|nr:leucyl aminopeptidase [Xanthomonadaceae bacterium JHOS43]MCX7562621.1 leucyl aminopeptidase [Xanthomonadaceae bacterium XH05]
MSLNLSLLRAHPAHIDTDAVVAAVFEDTGLSPAAQQLDEACGGRIARLLESGDVSGKAGRCALLLALDGIHAPRVLLVGVGESSKVDAGRFLKAAAESIRALKGGPVTRIHSALTEIDVVGRDADWKLRQAALAAFHASYTYTTTKKSAKASPLTALSLSGDDAAADQLRIAAGIADGVTLARELGNLPPNICNPAYLAEQAGHIAASNDKVSLEVLDREQMQALGMGSLLGVAQGSANPPKLIVLRYDGAATDQRPHVLVGKGITFDTGGISIKPGPGMEEMKFDMCGAASVLGAFLSAVQLGLRINLIAIAAAVENMPDGASYRPGDVLTSMSGKTIEVLNTDAEGRLILCDALTYAQRFNPATLIDVATLTGACVVALGKHAHGLMSRDDALAAELLAAGDASHDRAWRLPIWDDYQPMLDSVAADMANIGGKWAGAITAGCFLARFTEGQQRWAHLDIAGTAWDEGRKGLATGRPVNLLVEWLIGRQ